MELGKSDPSINSWISKLHIQVGKLHMRIVPRPGTSTMSVLRWVATWDGTVPWAGLWGGGRGTKYKNPKDI